jgi:hypothetical protein
VNPIIRAAIISGGWAAVVAALGYRYNRVTADATARATNANALAALDAAHQAQLWEKKAEAYVETIAGITRRQIFRFNILRPVRWDEATEQRLMEAAEPPEDADSAAAGARLHAFAPRPILDALRTANKANSQVDAKLREYNALVERSKVPVTGGPTGEAIMAALQAAHDAAVAADAADKMLMDVICADLALRPSDRANLPGAESPAAS